MLTRADNKKNFTPSQPFPCLFSYDQHTQFTKRIAYFALVIEENVKCCCAV
jgi:hypothetical protein